jgi:hypothetical protein
MKTLVLTAIALLAAAPAFAVTNVNAERDALRIAAERTDAWHIKHLGPVAFQELPPTLVESPISPETIVPSSAVPEPASWAMMLGGFGLIGGALRRRSIARVAS